MVHLRKPTFYLLFVLLILCACDENKCGSKAPDWIASDISASSVLTELCQELALRMDSGIMLGHEESLAYGSMWYNQPGRSDVKSVCGNYPAVVDWSLDGIESGASLSADSVPFVRIKQYVKQFYGHGGVTVFSWNPSWQSSLSGKTDSILSEQEFVQRYGKGLDRVAAFLMDLRSDSGSYIPVIVQLFDWTDLENVCSPEAYITLWRRSVDYLRNDKNVHHVLYAYSRNAVKTEEELTRYYPGNAYVDVVGLSLYQDFETDASGALYVQQLEQGLSVVCHFAQKNKKFPALTGTGLKGVKISNFFSGILDPVISRHKISYIVFGANMWNEEESYYIPIPGHPASEDFLNFVHSEHIIMCDNKL